MNVYLIFYITFLEIQLAYSLLYTDTNRKITAVGKFEATIIICLFVTSKDFTNCSSVVILLANNCSKSTIKTLEQPPKDVVLVYYCCLEQVISQMELLLYTHLYPAAIYLLKVNNGNNITICETVQS